jgi:hypothetical protein
MSECEKKQGYVGDDDAPKKENVSSSSSSSQYQSNSSLSSGSGEVTCVQMPWSKHATEKSSKKRKTNKGSKSPSPCSSTSANPVKLPVKRSKNWHRFASSSKKKESDVEAPGKSSVPPCVCTGYRRANSEAAEEVVTQPIPEEPQPPQSSTASKYTSAIYIYLIKGKNFTYLLAY